MEGDSTADTGPVDSHSDSDHGMPDSSDPIEVQEGFEAADSSRPNESDDQMGELDEAGEEVAGNPLMTALKLTSVNTTVDAGSDFVLPLPAELLPLGAVVSWSFRVKTDESDIAFGVSSTPARTDSSMQDEITADIKNAGAGLQTDGMQDTKENQGNKPDNKSDDEDNAGDHGDLDEDEAHDPEERTIGID